MPDQPIWRKPAGRCLLQVDDACVDVPAADGDQQHVAAARTFTDPHSTVVVLARAEWSALIAGAAGFTVA
jgi:hypothetical protein